MTGIFGYFAKNINNSTINKICAALMDEDYSIIRQICNNSSILGEINYKSIVRKELMTENEKKISIIACGEVYNNDIKNLSESILKLYKEGRLDKLKEFNGSFIAAIYDSPRNILTLVNDRNGIIKHYYYHDGHHFCFAPKINLLVKFGVKKSLRKEAIIDFFLFGYLLGDKTFFEKIHQLPPASILEFSADTVKITKYWDYVYDEEYNSRSKEDIIDDLGVLWQRAVQRRIPKDDTIIIPLSGGLDSRAILAAALKCTPKNNIITCTFGEPGSYDFEIGGLVAKKAGINNIPLGVDKENFMEQYSSSMDDVEAMIDVTPYFAIQSYNMIEKYGCKIYSGYFGDRIMGTHISKNLLKNKLIFQKNYNEANDIIFKTHTLYKIDIVQKLFNANFKYCDNYLHSFENSTNELKTIPIQDMANYCAIWDFKQRQQKYTMNAVFRFRERYRYCCPFLDNDLFDFMLKISPNLRLDKKLYKQMLIKKYPELFNLPTKTNLGLRLNVSIVSLFFRKVSIFLKDKINKISLKVINRNIFQNKGNNYKDYNDLLRRNNDYRYFIKSFLEKVKRRDFFNADYIEYLWNLHLQGKGNYATIFGLLITFEMMLERFFDE